MSADVNAAGWSQWSGNSNHLTAYFAEYNSMDLDGNPISVANRVSWSHQLDPNQIAPYSKQNWLKSGDNWNPIAASITPPLADFNGDNEVSGEDFLIWQRGVGLTGQTDNSNGDADYDGDVDFIDRAVWEYQFGNPVPLSAMNAPLPEPSSIVLCGAVVFAPYAMRRCSRTPRRCR